METREYCCRQLLEDAMQLYKEEVKQPMQHQHRSLLKEGLEYAMLEYAKQVPWESSIFCRAAYIGYCWFKVAPGDDKFGHEALSRTIYIFLKKEGVVFPPGSDRECFLQQVKTITKNDKLDPSEMFIKLQETIAYYCVCAEGNHRQDFEDKLCHCHPSKGKSRIVEIRGPRGRLLEAERNRLRSA